MSVGAIEFLIVNGLFAALLWLTLHMATRRTAEDSREAELVTGGAPTHPRGRGARESKSVTDRFKRLPFGVRFSIVLAMMVGVVAVRQTLLPWQ